MANSGKLFRIVGINHQGLSPQRHMTCALVNFTNAKWVSRRDDDSVWGHHIYRMANNLHRPVYNTLSGGVVEGDHERVICEKSPLLPMKFNVSATAGRCVACAGGFPALPEAGLPVSDPVCPCVCPG